MEGILSSWEENSKTSFEFWGIMRLEFVNLKEIFVFSLTVVSVLLNSADGMVFGWLGIRSYTEF